MITTFKKLALGGALAVAFVMLGPMSPADAQFDPDTYLCDQLGIGCPQDGNLVCTTPLSPGQDGTCTLGGVEGEDVQAVLTCGDDSSVVFQGTADSDPFTFSFTVPVNAPLGTCTMAVNGETFVITLVAPGTGALARTGTDFGPAIGLGAALVIIGSATLIGTRSRRRIAA